MAWMFFFWKCILFKLYFKKKYNKKIKLQMYVMPILPFCFVFFEGCNNVSRENFLENSRSWNGLRYSIRKLFRCCFPCSWTTNNDSHPRTNCGNELDLWSTICGKRATQILSFPRHLRRHQGHSFGSFLCYSRVHWLQQVSTEVENWGEKRYRNSRQSSFSLINFAFLTWS